MLSLKIFVRPCKGLFFFRITATMAKKTPMMQQYLEIKADYPDAILFFRLGDFYEMFMEDAVVASRILDITLTARNKGAAEEIPLCGIPFHSCQPYIAKLVQHSAQQISQPSLTSRYFCRYLTSLDLDWLGLGLAWTWTG